MRKLMSTDVVKLPMWFVSLVIALVAFDAMIGTAAAQQIITVTQGAGNNGRYPPWIVSPVGGAGVAITGSPINAPGIPATVSLAANTSGSICGLTPLSIYRVACSVSATYRTGAATPVALTSDNPLGAIPDREDNLKLNAAETCIAFISSSAGTCFASLRP